VEHFRTVRVTKDGYRIDVSLTVSPVRNTAGDIIGASKIARDISSQKKTEREREEALAQAQAAYRSAQLADAPELVDGERKTRYGLGWSVRRVVATRILRVGSVVAIEPVGSSTCSLAARLVEWPILRYLFTEIFFRACLPRRTRNQHPASEGC